jgi:hypothetical protein
MLDFNHRPTPAERIIEAIDAALEARHAAQKPRNYLGASRIGADCNRALQYEYLHTPVDTGRSFSGKLLRVFEAGHTFEAMAAGWLRLAGFDLFTEKADGQQFGFAAAGGRIRGHVDGIINGAPTELRLTFPMLWECKALNNKSWKDTQKRGLVLSKPVYAAQIAIYQAYLDGSVPGVASNPTLFTAINKDTAEIYIELLPFDAALAQKMSDRAVNILQACDAHELLPRIANDSAHHVCTMCAWQDRCWGQP